MKNRQYLVFAISLVVVILNIFPLGHGDTAAWLWLVFNGMGVLLTCWLIISIFMGSEDLKPLILGIIAANILVLLYKYLPKLF